VRLGTKVAARKDHRTVWKNVKPVGFACIWVVMAPITACTTINQIRTRGRVSVRPGQDTAWFGWRGSSSVFEIPLIVRNASAVPIYTERCGITAEKLIGTKWQRVFTSTCLSASYGRISPGDSGVFDFVSFPPSDKRMTAGMYRAVVSLWWQDEAGNQLGLPEAKRRSSPFIVARK